LGEFTANDCGEAHKTPEKVGKGGFGFTVIVTASEFKQPYEVFAKAVYVVVEDGVTVIVVQA
jgi:hypothetical protein